MKNVSNGRTRARRTRRVSVEHNNLILNGVILVIVSALLGVGIYYIIQAENSKNSPSRPVRPIRPYPRCGRNYIWSIDKHRCVRKYR